MVQTEPEPATQAHKAKRAWAFLIAIMLLSPVIIVAFVALSSYLSDATYVSPYYLEFYD